MRVIKLGTVAMNAAHFLSVVAEIGDTVVETVGAPVMEDVEDPDPGHVHSKEDPVEGPVPNPKADLETDIAVIRTEIGDEQFQGIAQYQNQGISDLLQENEGQPLVLTKDHEAAQSLAPSLAPNLNPALDLNRNPDLDLRKVTDH